MTRACDSYHPNPQGDVLGLISRLYEAANDPERVRKYSDQIEMLVRTHMAPQDLAAQYPKLNLTRIEARLFGRLHRLVGEGVSRQSLMDAIYFDFLGEEPHDKIIDVFVCHIRQKLKDANIPLKIQSIWGFGFKMAAA